MDAAEAEDRGATGPSAENDPRETRAAENREERRLFLRFRERGDPSAFEELVRRTEARVRAVALAVLRDPSGAEDAAQEAFLRAFRRADSYRGDGPVAAWLCRISVRCAHDRLRRAERRRRLLDLVRGGPAASVPGPEPASDEAADALRTGAELRAALGRLPAPEREALLLKEVLGMTYREIAASGGVPLGTVQSRIHRARLRLADALTSGPPPNAREGRR